MKKINYPFTAIVGQDELLLAIILNIINPKIGGLLIKGVKGSGKSTAVYSMTDIIPKIKIMKDCKFNCDPDKPKEWCDDCKKRFSDGNENIMIKDLDIASIPLSITEDRLLGNVDVELLLKEGKYRFIPGVLAKAHRQILYIDEVNLLPDYIIDDILDVSAMGWNKIEREGFSISHPSKFLLIGTMNPEEGELRPQILDRFPLSVMLSSVTDQKLRKEIIKRNLAYEKDSAFFRNQFVEETEALKNIIKLARNSINDVSIDYYFYDIVVKLCSDYQIDGHRADITIIKTAKTYTAFEMRKRVEIRHIKQAAKFVLSHRTRDGGLLKPLTENEIDDYFLQIAKNSKHHLNKFTPSQEINKDINLFQEGGLIQLEKK